MTVFTPRTSAPTKNDLYFVRKANGGYSSCIAGKPQSFTGSVLSNCVGYAWGRVAELEGMGDKCTIGVPTARLKVGKYNPTSAYAWMSYANGRKTGTTPKLGAVAVWKKNNANSGHVAIVSEIYADGSWLSEESSYGGTTFQNKKYNKNSAKSGFTFKGFIYLNVEFEPIYKFPVGTKIQIIGTGNSKYNGKGKTSKGIGYKRYILGIIKDAPYPYKVGNKLGVVTGYYPEKSLKAI